MDVEAYLKSKGLRVRLAGTQLHVPCMFCGEDLSKRGRLYIDNSGPDTAGLYHCKLCDARGNFRTLQKFYGDQIDLVDDAAHARHEILNEAATFYADNLHPDVLGWLKRKRGLRTETVVDQKLGWAPSEDRTALVRHLRSKGYRFEDMVTTGLVVERNGQHRDFLQGLVTIPYMVQGNVVMIRGKDMAGKYVTPPNQKTRLFNTDVLMSEGDVVVCEGEFDALVMQQLGYNAVASPGANVWQDTWRASFDMARHKRVFLVFDPDEAGQKGAMNVKLELGFKARIVVLPVESDEDAKDVDPSYLVVQKGKDRDFFEELFKKAVIAGSLLVTVDEAFEEWEAIQGVDGLKLGFEELDVSIAPGLLPAQVAVILAKTNSGKTLTLLNIFQRMAMLQDDVKVLFVSLEQTRGDWFERARRIWNFYNLATPRKEVNKKTLDFWRPRLEMVDKNRISEEELVACIDEYELKHGRRPDLVAVDYLGYWANGFKAKDRYEKVSDAVMSLKAVAKEKRLPIVTPHQVNRMAEFGQELQVDQARDSVAGDTRILLADGSYIAIRDLVGTTPDVITTTPDYTFSSRSSIRVWAKGERQTLTVTTQSGRTFTATPEHPMLCAARGWVYTSDLVTGDRVAVPDHVPVFGDNVLLHAELLGHLVADGGLTRSPIEYTEGNDSVRDRVAELARSAGVDPKPKKGEPFTIRLSGAGERPNPVTQLVRDAGLFGIKSPQRFVPDQVFTAREEDVAAFLRGLISSDGGVVLPVTVRFASASERLARDVQHLLSRFGVRSNLKRAAYSKGAYVKGFYWRVEVRQADSVRLFARKIGLVGDKQRALQAITLTDRLAHHVDLFPETVMDEIHATRKLNGLGWNVLSPTGNPKRTSIVNGRELRRDKLLRLAEAVGSKRLRDVANSPLTFDKITSIERGPVEVVYDMTVVGTRNFVGDFVYSNSGAVEETADFVLALWAPDSIRGLSPEERKGVVHLKIGKTRHGGKGNKLDLQFAPLTLAMVPSVGDLSHLHFARKELDYAIRRDTWEHAIWRHRTGLHDQIVSLDDIE